MSNIALRKRRLTTSELSTLTAEKGEVYINISASTGTSSQTGQAGMTLVVHDGSTVGGIPLAPWVHTHANATEGTAGFMSSTDKTKLDALSSAGGVQVVENAGVPLPAETTINFDTNFTLTDNPGELRTDITLSNLFFDQINSQTIALIVALS
jgi:hypothetical protein